MSFLAGLDDGELFKQATWVSALAHRLVRDAAAADDVVQEVWLAAVCRVRANEAAPRGWLARVAYKQAALRARGERHRREREERASKSEALPSAADLAARAELANQLVERVLELDEPYRRIVLLRFFENLTPDEIARRRGIPGSTVRNQLARALAQLRERLDARHGGRRREWVLALVPLARDAHAPELAVELALATLADTPPVALACGVLLALALILGVSLLTDPWPSAGVTAGAVSVREAQGVDPVGERPSQEVAKAARSDARPPDEPVAPSASPAPSRTRIRGIVVDESTRTPIPGARISIAAELDPPRIGARGLLDAAANEPEIVECAADGTFSSAREYASGRVSFEDVDGGTSPVSRNGSAVGTSVPPETVEIDWRAGDQVIVPLPVATTVRLEIRPRSVAARNAWWLRYYDRDPCGGSGRASMQRSRVRGAQRMSARFSLLVSNDSADGESLLEVESEDGLWLGRLVVPGTPLDPEQLYVLDVHPAGRLELVLSRADRRAIVAPSVVAIDLDGGCGIGASRERAWNAARRVCSVGGLAPGRYRVHVGASGCEAVRADALVRAGAVTRLDLELSAAEASDASPDRPERLGPVHELLLRALDARTGEDLDPRWDLLVDGDAWHTYDEEDQRAASAGEVPDAADLLWRVSAEGYVPEQGTRAELVARGDQLVLTARLRRGWGAIVSVVDFVGGDPVPGATISLDGVVAGVTDASGHLLVASDRAPLIVAAALDAWLTTPASSRANVAAGEWVKLVLVR